MPTKYIAVMVFEDGETIEDDILCDTVEEALSRAEDMGADYATGMETLHLNDPIEYPDEDGDDYDIEIREIEVED